MKRILVFRHGEEPDDKKYKDIHSKIGLSKQGGIRALMMPDILNSIFNGDNYEVHTYSNDNLSRSFLTCQLFDNIVLYDKSDDIDELVKGVKKSGSNNIIICWNHSYIPDIIHELIGVDKPDYDDIVKKIWFSLNNLEIKPLKEVYIDDSSLIDIKLANKKYQRKNINVNDHLVHGIDELKYSIFWDLNRHDNNVISRGELDAKVKIGFMIDKIGNNWLVSKYI